VLGAGNAGRFFVCSSDADVPALGADELLRPGQIYFVLPAAMLGRAGEHQARTRAAAADSRRCASRR
jgi:hypothetical protein